MGRHHHVDNHNQARTPLFRRHLSREEVLFTGHLEADADLGWIDDDDRADALAELANLVARERRAAREEYERSRGAPIHRHPAEGQR